jgi:hypothetical protein
VRVNLNFCFWRTLAVCQREFLTQNGLGTPGGDRGQKRETRIRTRNLKERPLIDYRRSVQIPQFSLRPAFQGMPWKAGRRADSPVLLPLAGGRAR